MRPDQMKAVVAFPSTAIFGQEAALAFHERDMLAAFETSFAYDEQSAFAAMVRALPSPVRVRVEPQLRRRAIAALPSNVVRTSPFWEVMRTLAQQGGASPVLVDRIWDHLSHRFTCHVATRLQPPVTAVYAYEYTALEAFKAAADRGILRVLDFPSLNSREFEQQQLAEKAMFPELKGPHETYFDARFEQRQARRDAEMQLADLIITNSSVTRASHIAGGAPGDRTFAVPYGAPPTIDAIRSRDINGPLRVIWAGTFNIRKGAHYFVDAWRKLAAGKAAQADVYGAIVLPDHFWKPAPVGMTFHGSVIRPVLFDAYEAADVLVFPTLSDGFGMVVTEAFARGLPVITTDRAGASDLLRNGENGLIIPAGDAAALERAIQWCLDNRETLRSMREAALDTACSWQWADYRQALANVVTGRSTDLLQGPSGTERRLAFTKR
jgi:glycosyltransferase involved in cell wall biosynthesis